MADRKISDLTALTAPAAGDYLPIVDISEVAAASKNKRITIEELFRGVPLGTAAAPSIAIEGDENTGIYSPGADQLAISTNGTGRLFVDASGNVGIGTAGPLNKLTVGNSGAESFNINPGSTANNNIVLHYNWSSASYVTAETRAAQHVFAIQTTERMRLDSSGRLGLGTSSPTDGLHVYATSTTNYALNLDGPYNGSDTNNYIAFSGNGTKALIGKLYRPTAGNAIRLDVNFAAFIIGTGSGGTATERARIDSSGRLLVGTSSSPAGDVALLQVQGYSGTPTGVGLVTLKAGTTTPADATGLGRIDFGDSNSNRGSIISAERDGGTWTSGSSHPGRLTFFTTVNGAANPTERMRITSAGNVGIGTTVPQNSLSIGSNVGGQIGLSLDWTGTGGPYQVAGLTADRSSGEIRQYAYTNFFPTFYSNGSERARIDTSGRLLVGTSNSTDNTRLNQKLAIVNTGSGNYAGMGIVNYGGAPAAAAPFIDLKRSRGTTDGSYTEVAADDALGYLVFQGADGAGWSEGAAIAAFADGDWTTSGDTTDSPGRLVFSTTADGAASPTERMRISSTGQVSINTTADPVTAFFDGTLRVASSTTTTSFRGTGVAGAILQSLWHEATSGDNQFVSFGTETTRLTRGSISYNRAGGLVAYNTTSDYRAKTILGDIDNSGKAIDALKVYRGVMNGATVERPMLVAHEAQEVAPYCVTGEKDAVDDDGNPIYQQMDHQALVPLLIAEIQQLRNRVAALEGA
jgi:hypothetical protein